MSDNLKKRCDHPRRQWAKCGCPWYLDWQWKGRPVRLSLTKHADWPDDKVMTKSDAEGLRDEIKRQVRAGTFGSPPSGPAAGALTFGDVCEQYERRYVHVPTRRPRAAKEMARQVHVLRDFAVPGANGSTVTLGAKPIAAIAKGDVEALRDHRRRQIAASQAALAEVGRLTAEGAPVPADLARASLMARRANKAGEVSTNRLLRRLQHLFAWSLAEGFCVETPFKRNGVVVIKPNSSAERARSRRLEADEEPRLLAAAGDHLRAVIVASLETGCRPSEVMTLQWADVDLEAQTLTIPAEKAKTNVGRTIPVTGRLVAVLEMRRELVKTTLNQQQQPGEEAIDVPGTAYVFGDEIGGRVKSVRMAWRGACRRAGIAGLHLHDLRRECGSRLLETPGVSVLDVRDWLGHASVVMTNTYLATTIDSLQGVRQKVEAARAKAERAKTRGAGIRRTTVAQKRNRPAPIEATGRIC